MTNVCVVQNYSRRPCIFHKCLRCLLLSPLMLMIIRAGRSDRLLSLSRSRTRATCAARARTHTHLCTHVHTHLHICMLPPTELRHIGTHVVQTHAAITLTLAVSVQFLLIFFFWPAHFPSLYSISHLIVTLSSENTCRPTERPVYQDQD